MNQTFQSQQGEREADFINCVTWRKQAENTANFLKKGSLAGIEGRIQTSNFEGQDGKRVFMTEVVADSVQFLEPRSASAEDRSGAGDGAPYQGAQQSEQPYYQISSNRINNIRINNQISKTIHVQTMIHFRQAEVR